MLDAKDVARPKGRGKYMGPLFKHAFIVPMCNRPLNVTLLNSRVYDVETHWFKRMHRICTLPSGKCFPCSINLPTNPLAYIFAQVDGTSRVGVVKLTPRMVEEEAAFRVYTDLRGVKCTYWRPGAYERGPCKIRIDGETFDKSTLPSEPNIEAWVLTMFSKLVLSGDEERQS